MIAPMTAEAIVPLITHRLKKPVPISIKLKKSMMISPVRALRPNTSHMILSRKRFEKK